MRISVSAAVFCVLFALQVSQVQASLGPVQHDGIKMPAGVSTPKSIGFSEIIERGPDRRTMRDESAFATCVLALIPDFVERITDSNNQLGSYKGCGPLYEETDSFCELTEDAYLGDFDSRFASGGAFAASNTVLFPVETWGPKACFGSEEDCCELNAGLVAGIVIGCTVGLTLLIVACAWCCKCCCFKRKVQPAQPGVVMMQPAYVLPK
jgi:hypothetical protein